MLVNWAALIHKNVDSSDQISTINKMAARDCVCPSIKQNWFDSVRMVWLCLEPEMYGAHRHTWPAFMRTHVYNKSSLTVGY